MSSGFSGEGDEKDGADGDGRRSRMGLGGERAARARDEAGWRRVAVTTADCEGEGHLRTSRTKSKLSRSAMLYSTPKLP